MAWEIPGFSFSLPANIDMSSEAVYQFTPVRALAATGTGINTPVACAPVAASGDMAIGILQNNPQLAEAGTIVCNGISKVLCGVAFTIGQQLMANPLGGVAPAGSGKYSIGVGLDVGSPGTISTMLLVNTGKQ